MATFIPEWVRVPGRHVHVKRVLNALDDACLVRRPLRPRADAPDFFVEHPDRGWLAVAVEDAPFADIAPGQLFEVAGQARFEQRLASLQCLGREAASEDAAVRPMESLVILWSCTVGEASALTRHYLARYGVRLVAREKFMQLGAKLIGALLAPLPEAAVQALRLRHFPEAEIAVACAARRFYARDNRARLQRLFLDAPQEWAAKLDLEPPPEQAEAARDFSVRLVNGVAGSGKTLIALSRALLLSELFPQQRVLVLIHNTPIVADLRERLQRARGGLPPNLDITTFFAWAHAQWRAVFDAFPAMPQGPRRVLDLLRQARLHWPELKLPDALLMEELDFINEALVRDEAHYLDISRAGRGFALRPRERSLVWATHAFVAQQLGVAGLRLWSALPREICLAGRGQERLRRYGHILVDEAQFFAPSWFELVKRSLAREGQLFLCADPNQGFMKSRLSWKSVGLDVAGRTKKLRKSYRTTRAILEAAGGVLATLVPGDDDDYLAPDLADMAPGVPPTLVYTATPQDAMDRLVNEVAAVAATGGTPLGALLVVYGDNVQKHGLYTALRIRLGHERVWWFNERDQKKAPPRSQSRDYLRMAYLDTATGLEGGVVYLLGFEGLFASAQGADLGEPAQAALRREESARKLYMGMTRAGQRLVLLSCERLPPALEALFEVEAREAGN